MMTLSSLDPHLFRWKRLKKNVPSTEKVYVKNKEISQWRRQVEKASEAAIYEVFPHKKPSSRSKNVLVPLQSSKQLEDFDDAYREAEAVICDWMGAKLRFDLEEEEEDDDDEMVMGGEQMRSTERRGPAARLTALNYNNFDDLYQHLAKEDEPHAVDSFLQELMEQEVLDCGMVEELTLDAGQTRRKFRDPLIMMAARRQQVRENRAKREEERQRQRRERLARLIAAEEEKRRRREEELKRKQEARREEELLQQEVVKLRRQMEEKRITEQLLRQREKEEAERSATSSQSAPPAPAPAPPPPTDQQQQQDSEKLHKEQKIQLMVHMQSFKFLQSHFSGWYSLVLERRLRVGKAVALWGWRIQLRAWRAWRAAVWERRHQREVEMLRDANRQSQLAMESDRRRLLRRCLREWQLWCRAEKQRLVFLSQQEETQRKMAALIKAAAAGKLKAKEKAHPEAARAEAARAEAALVPPRVFKQPRPPKKDRSSSSAPAAPAAGAAVGPAPPTQPWQVSRRSTAPTDAELSRARQRREGGCFENRHAAQQQIISQQRKLLREQEQQILLMREKQSMMDLQMRALPVVHIGFPPAAGSESHGADPPPPSGRRQSIGGEADSGGAPPSRAVTRQEHRRPFVAEMEARAAQRAERKKEFEEHKRKREDEKLAQLKAAEAQRQREEEEQKRKAAEKRKEEKRLEKLREEEKRRQLKRQQELLQGARQHYTRSLLLHRGLAPWKRFIQIKRDNTQLAQSHHNLFLLRRCTLGWRQSARESLSEREAAADRLQRRFLLRRSLSCWERLWEHRRIQEEQAQDFHRTRTLKRYLLALLDHMTQLKHEEWRQMKVAEEHRSRRVLQQCLVAWRQFPDAQRVEREKEARRVRLGRKVSAVLPDFGTYPL